MWMNIGSYMYVVEKVTLPPVPDVNCTLPSFVEFYQQNIVNTTDQVSFVPYLLEFHTYGRLADDQRIMERASI